jgi:inorganic pyrophosphatase
MKKINATHFEDIPAIPDEADDYVVHAIIETPRDIRHKYALEPKYGIFKLKQTIADGLQWPYDYGFIPQTLADDGDPLDIVFLCEAATFTGCLVEARVLGIIRLEKNGIANDRIVACPLRQKGVAQSSDRFDTIDDLPKKSMDSLCRFLVEYSSMEGNEITFVGVQSRKKAMASIDEKMKVFRKKKKSK